MRLRRNFRTCRKDSGWSNTHLYFIYHYIVSFLSCTYTIFPCAHIYMLFRTWSWCCPILRKSSMSAHTYSQTPSMAYGSVSTIMLFACLWLTTALHLSLFDKCSQTALNAYMHAYIHTWRAHIHRHHMHRSYNIHTNHTHRSYVQSIRAYIYTYIHTHIDRHMRSLHFLR